ncbi:MAG: hypothetical protein OXG08_06090 [Gammaproteobacteria bacterium]|nr:hypothetical protein [Gammaproteobacteria bacterium]
MRKRDMSPVTDKKIFDDILQQMSDGVAPWRQPWSDTTLSVVIGAMKYPARLWPSNVRAPRVRFGMFIGFLLLSQASLMNYRTNLWIPQTVLRELDAELAKPDEQPVAIRDFDDEGNETQKRLVYNIDQVRDCERTLGLTFTFARPISLTAR